MFHLQFLIIHPFSDGNGRTARIITATNLLKQGLLPGIITNENKKEYCKIIETRDPNMLAQFFEELSFKEDIIFAQMYEKYKKSEDIFRKL
jgi:Fic family protein